MRRQHECVSRLSGRHAAIQLSVLVAVFGVLVGGCVSLRYRYISLEKVPDIRVQALGRARLARRLIWHREMPLEYVLTRDRYVLRMSIDPKHFGPHVRISVEGLPVRPLMLLPRPERVRRSATSRPCGTYNGTQVAPAFQFTWVICSRGEGVEEMSISFDVVGADGLLIAEENLPFELIDNGVYMVPEGL